MIGRVSDNDDRTIELLEAILREVSNYEAPELEMDVREGDTIVDPGAKHRGRFTTGPNGITLEEAGMDEYREIDLGFQAGTINIRSDAALYIAFEDPSNNPGRLIPIAADEFAFTIGGSNPIASDTLYMTQQDETADPVGVDIIAYR